MVHENKRMLTSKVRLVTGLIFFLFCYVYLLIVIKPHLIYHGYGTLIQDVPVFSTGWEFLGDSLSVPGGLVEYFYGLLSQGYYTSWLGALFIVLVALSLYGLSRRHYAYVGHPDFTILPFFPAVIIVLIYNHYDHPLAACLASCMGLLLSLGFETIPVRRTLIRMVIFCLMAAAGYWFAGAGGVFVFSLMSAVYVFFIRRNRLSAVLILPATVAIIWGLAEYVFHLSLKQALLVLTPHIPESDMDAKTLSELLIIALYVFVPVTVFSICLWKILFKKDGHDRVVHSRKTKGKRARAVSQRQGAFSARFKKFIMPTVPIIVLVAGLYFSNDRIRRQIVLMNYLSRRDRWSEVLDLGHRLPKNIYNIYCNHDINRALYDAGRLGYDMLCFPQNPHAFLLTHEQEESSMTQVKLCDTLIELGNVNYAEKLASEFLAVEGRMGMVLEKLAWINIIKGQNDTARIYLNVLKKDLMYRDKADSMLNHLKNGFEASDAAYIQRIGSYIRRDENARLYKESIEEMLTGLIRQNPNNQMAFEYLMACYLLAGQLEKIATNAECLADLGYQEVPILYEEAILIYQGMYGRKPDLGKFKIKPETVERYNRFVRLYNSMQPQNRQPVLQQLIREFGTSYFFYYRFTISKPSGIPPR